MSPTVRCARLCHADHFHRVTVTSFRIGPTAASRAAPSLDEVPTNRTPPAPRRGRQPPVPAPSPRYVRHMQSPQPARSSWKKSASSMSQASAEITPITTANTLPATTTSIGSANRANPEAISNNDPIRVPSANASGAAAGGRGRRRADSAESAERDHQRQQERRRARATCSRCSSAPRACWPNMPASRDVATAPVEAATPRAATAVATTCRREQYHQHAAADEGCPRPQRSQPLHPPRAPPRQFRKTAKAPASATNDAPIGRRAGRAGRRHKQRRSGVRRSAHPPTTSRQIGTTRKRFKRGPPKGRSGRHAQGDRAHGTTRDCAGSGHRQTVAAVSAGARPCAPA